MDEVRSVVEADASLTELGVRLPDVVDDEVDDRAGPPLVLLDLPEEQPGATAVEEREVAEREQVREPEPVTVERLRSVDPADQQRHLADRRETRARRAHACLLRRCAGAAGRIAGPVAQRSRVRHTQLLRDAPDVVLDRAGADAAPAERTVAPAARVFPPLSSEASAGSDRRRGDDGFG
jgi:hypothetical protein